MRKCRDGRDIISYIYRGIYGLVSNAQGRHPDAFSFTAPTWLCVAPCLSTSTICDWQAIGVRRYDPGWTLDLLDLECGILLSYHSYHGVKVGPLSSQQTIYFEGCFW